MIPLIKDTELLQITAQALNPSDSFFQVALAANTAKTLAIPADSQFVIFSATADFYVRYDGSAATVPTSSTWAVGNAELNPGVRVVTPGSTISVIAPAGAVITAAFYS